jgi:glutamate-ammonia-ligase adenylyltransferase
MSPLVDRFSPCGPVIDAAAAERAREILIPAADAAGWRDLLDRAWPALAPVFGASPYLAGLARGVPDRLKRALESDPDAAMSAILADVQGLEAEPDVETVRRQLRRRKGDAHLLIALADLGGVWDLDRVTRGLTALADASVRAALAAAVRQEVERGRLRSADTERGPIPGFFCIAMGKHGAFELNYSSDIDVSLFYEPELMPLGEGAEHQDVAARLARSLSQLLQERTADGYVFRVDLRLRPDPSATPAAVPTPAALEYYETVGQNWERAAFIKARAVAGDSDSAAAFLQELQPFVWRRNLDFASIEDIHSIKRQIHVHKVDERLDPRGANLKLGRGGIREVEFFVQTQQLILGGRNPALRSNRTLDALAALTQAGQVASATAQALAADYAALRALEHRVQMLADEQTHILPERDADRQRVAALWGETDLKAFDAAVGAILQRVNTAYGELFAEDEQLSSEFGSLVFTGVDDDPETLATLSRMGFSNPSRVSATIRAWHHGRIGPTRTERGR